eukprot:288805-Pelagomonas_calceolata.AAC.6
MEEIRFNAFPYECPSHLELNRTRYLLPAQIKHGSSQISGAVYIGSANHRKMLDQFHQHRITPPPPPRALDELDWSGSSSWDVQTIPKYLFHLLPALPCPRILILAGLQHVCCQQPAARERVPICAADGGRGGGNDWAHAGRWGRGQPGRVWRNDLRC